MRFTVFAGLVFLLTVSVLAADRRTERALKEGLRLEAAGQFATAEQAFTDVIAQDPSEAAAYLHRGRVRLITGRAKEALEDADAAVRLLSNTGEPFELRARVLIGLGRATEGIKDYDRAIELGLDSASVYNSRA